jgi:tRNA(fMet)-specific endonuclease VapC
MKYLLDTNIIAYIINKRPIEVFNRFHSLELNEISTSSIVVAELWFGVAKSQRKVQNKIALENFLAELTIFDFDIRAAESYAIIRADLESKGTIIGANDLLISAHAVSLGLTLITNNAREFQRINELKIENWLTE